MDTLLPLDTQETGRGSVIFKGESVLHAGAADPFWLAVVQRIERSGNHKAPDYEIKIIYLGPTVPFPKEKIHAETVLTSQPREQIPYYLQKYIHARHNLLVILEAWEEPLSRAHLFARSRFSLAVDLVKVKASREECGFL